MKVLITGGAGFIGSHLAERHLASGDEVHIVDDLSTGSMANIQHLKSDPRFQYCIDSMTNTRLMAELVDSSDLIYHLAAAVGVRLVVESPVRTIETNVRGTEVILSLAAKKGKRVLITSTSEVYGTSTCSIPLKTTTWFWVQPIRAAGAMRVPKPSTNFLPLLTGKRRSFPSLSPGYLIPLDRARPAATEWWSPILPPSA